MGCKIGIVGMPNVGKSTIFNILSNDHNAMTGNYPFCTKEPNSALVEVFDDALVKAAAISKSKKIIFSSVEFIDIAGLIKGASKGEGLGNQFLATIREVDIIIHVVRCFANDDINHVRQGPIQPALDIEDVSYELLASDISSIEKRMHKLNKTKDAAQLKSLQKIIDILTGSNFKQELAQNFTPQEIQQMQLLSTKHVIYVCNVDESYFTSKEINADLQQAIAYIQNIGDEFIIVPIKLEEGLIGYNRDQRIEFLQEIGIQDELSITKLITKGFDMLNLHSFFTLGDKEARSWSIAKGATALEAAGRIHSDFQKKFIKAEVTSYDDYIALGGEIHCKSKGKVRLEGKQYIVNTSDIINFKHS